MAAARRVTAREKTSEAGVGWISGDLRAEGMRSSGAAKGGVRAVREVAFIWTEVEDDDGVGGWLWAEEKSAKRGS